MPLGFPPQLSSAGQPPLAPWPQPAARAVATPRASRLRICSRIPIILEEEPPAGLHAVVHAPDAVAEALVLALVRDGHLEGGRDGPPCRAVRVPPQVPDERLALHGRQFERIR